MSLISYQKLFKKFAKFVEDDEKQNIHVYILNEILNNKLSFKGTLSTIRTRFVEDKSNFHVVREYPYDFKHSENYDEVLEKVDVFEEMDEDSIFDNDIKELKNILSNDTLKYTKLKNLLKKYDIIPMYSTQETKTITDLPEERFLFLKISYKQDSDLITDKQSNDSTDNLKVFYISNIHIDFNKDFERNTTMKQDTNDKLCVMLPNNTLTRQFKYIAENIFDNPNYQNMSFAEIVEKIKLERDVIYNLCQNTLDKEKCNVASNNVIEVIFQILNGRIRRGPTKKRKEKADS